MGLQVGPGTQTKPVHCPEQQSPLQAHPCPSAAHPAPQTPPSHFPEQQADACEQAAPSLRQGMQAPPMQRLEQHCGLALHCCPLPLHPAEPHSATLLHWP